MAHIANLLTAVTVKLELTFSNADWSSFIFLFLFSFFYSVILFWSSICLQPKRCSVTFAAGRRRRPTGSTCAAAATSPKRSALCSASRAANRWPSTTKAVNKKPKKKNRKQKRKNKEKETQPSLFWCSRTLWSFPWMLT